MEIIKDMKEEVRTIKKAPFAFLLFLVIGGTIGYAASNFYYSKQIADKDGQLSRYRVALGIDPASKGALVELNNQELALRAQSIVAKMRQFDAVFEEKSKIIDEQVKLGKLDKKQAFDQKTQAMKNVSHSFDENLASDAINMESELRRRMSQEAMTHIVRAPAFVFKDENGNVTGRITLLGMIRGGDDSATMIRVFADEIEAMAKLLPNSN